MTVRVWNGEGKYMCVPIPPVVTRWKRASLREVDDEVEHGLSIDAVGNIKDDAIADQTMLLVSVKSVSTQHLCLSYL